MKTQTRKRIPAFFVLTALFLGMMAGIATWQAIGADGVNPRADFWRVVRLGLPGYTAVSSTGHKVLIQNGGENWREIRNSLIMPYSQWIMGLALAAMGLFFIFIGRDRLEKPLSGIRIVRFTFGERFLHWYTAVLFISMAVTGLSLLLGRLALIPYFGHQAVAGYLQAAKVVHNYGGPLFLAGVVLEFIIWVRHNIPKKIDLRWFRNMGGLIGSGPRPHSEKINGGEKAWFWLMILFSIGVGITGVLLDFPIWGQSRFTMQVSHVIHASVAILFITASFGHIYMGTLGAEGALEGMWKGSVDAAWAQQHQDLWYEQKMHEKKGAAETL